MIKTPYLILSEKCKQILTFGLSRDVTSCLAWQCHNQTRKVNLFDVVATCWKPVTATNNTSATTNRSIGRFPNDRLKMASPATAYEP
jgi:hypothetical protein